MIYLDNAATTFPKPPKVYERLTECIKEYCGNPGRSSHYLSRKSDEEIYRTRELVAELVGINAPERVVFTQNATHALNLAIKTRIPDGSHVIISDIEHNAVIRPLSALCKKRGVSYSVFSTKENSVDSIEKLINEKTSAVICNLVSNVNGMAVDFDGISTVCGKHGLTLIADASQKIGHTKIDLSGGGCDILCAPGHKSLFGIQGVGFAIINDGFLADSFIEGGGGSESRLREMPMYLPDRYEAGTLPTPSIVSLGAGIEFVLEHGIYEIKRKIEYLTALTLSELSENKHICDLSGNNGVVSFNVMGIPSMRVSELLDGYGICTRAGLHCAPLSHRGLGTLKNGSVRVSFSYLNQVEDVYALFKALGQIIKVYT